MKYFDSQNWQQHVGQIFVLVRTVEASKLQDKRCLDPLSPTLLTTPSSSLLSTSFGLSLHKPVTGTLCSQRQNVKGTKKKKGRKRKDHNKKNFLMCSHFIILPLFLGNYTFHYGHQESHQRPNLMHKC